MKKRLGLAAAGLFGLAVMAAAPANAQQGSPLQGKPNKAVTGGGSGKPLVSPVKPHAQHQGGGGHGGGHKHKSNTGRNVAAGVAAGVIGAIILNEAAKASSGGDSYSSSSGDGELSCRQLERRCDDGKDWACRKYDRQGC